MGALTRLDSLRAGLQLMGLMPSAYSSGAQWRQGAMTKAGTPQARRVWGEGAWA
jgi:transposase